VSWIAVTVKFWEEDTPKGLRELATSDGLNYKCPRSCHTTRLRVRGPAYGWWETTTGRSDGTFFLQTSHSSIQFGIALHCVIMHPVTSKLWDN